MATVTIEPVNNLPPHLKFRRDALALAATLKASDFAFDFDPPADNTVESLARTLAIVAGGYAFTVDDNNRLAACVTGDQGYASTNIVLDLPGFLTSEALAQARAEGKAEGMRDGRSIAVNYPFTEIAEAHSNQAVVMNVAQNIAAAILAALPSPPADGETKP